MRASEPDGFDAEFWAAFCEMAGPTIGVPEKLGGGGASLLDLELVCEQIGSFLAPVPFIEGAVACRALASSGDPGSRCLDQLIAEPATVATIALRPVAGGTATLVPYGPVARAVVAMDAGELVLVTGDGDGVDRANLGSSSLADRSFRGPGRSVLASGEIARAAYGLALDEWRTLMSGALVGLGEAALAIGVEYAKNRVQFGAPVGSFQSNRPRPGGCSHPGGRRTAPRPRGVMTPDHILFGSDYPHPEGLAEPFEWAAEVSALYPEDDVRKIMGANMFGLLGMDVPA